MTQPLVGFGLDFNLQPPATMRRLHEKFGHRLSHCSVVAMETVGDAETFRDIFKGLPLIHHLSNVAPGDAHGPHLDRLEQLDVLTRTLNAAWCGEDIGAWCIGPYAIPYFAAPLFEREVAELIGTRVASVIAKSSRPFLAEVPSCSFVAGRMSLGEFFHELVSRSGCGVVLDVSHVYSYALYQGLAPEAVLASLPLDAVWECHIAGGRADAKNPSVYIDNHFDRILPEVVELLGLAAARCPNLKAVTYEFAAKCTDEQVDAELSRLEQALSAQNFTARIRQPVPAPQ